MILEANSTVWERLFFVQVVQLKIIIVTFKDNCFGQRSFFVQLT